MSLFIDLRHLKYSVATLSDVVDKMTTNVNTGDQRRGFFENAFKPSVGVRFAHSQEDVCRETQSSRLKPHLSLPNLDKGIFDRGFSSPRRNSQPKIVEIQEESCVPIDQIGNWIAASARKRPMFDDTGDRHPMDFLEDLDTYFEQLRVSEDQKLPLALSCLEGVPKLWARCFRSDLRSFKEFSKAFSEEFWDSEHQKSVLYDLKLGKYDSGSGMSMAEYFLHKVFSCRHLDPPLSDLEIVYSLAAHFPTSVELEMRLSQRPSVKDAYRMLRRRDAHGAEFLPNYLFEMCESYQNSHRPHSFRRKTASPDLSARTEPDKTN